VPGASLGLPQRDGAGSVFSLRHDGTAEIAGITEEISQAVRGWGF
jgi:hypothetical protein